MRKLFLLIFTNTFIFSILLAETDNSIETISVSQGLPNAQVNQIFLGNNGVFWIGTSNGLCLYDGYSFTVLQSIPFDVKSLADDNILKITQDRKGNIWLLSHYGIEYLDVSTLQIKRFKYIPDYAHVVSIVSSDIGNNIYVVYINQILKINCDNFTVDDLKIDPGFDVKEALNYNGYLYFIGSGKIASLNLQFNTLTSRNLDNEDNTEGEYHFNIFDSNHLLYSHDNSLGIYTISTGTSQIVYRFNSPIKSCGSLSNNKVALATNNTMYQVDLDSTLNIIEVIKIFESTDISVSNLVQDNKSLIWAATNKGIIKINPYSRQIKHNSLEKLTINDKSINEVLVESSRRGLLIKDSDKNYRFFNSKTNKYFKISITDKPASCLLSDNQLYIGTDNGLITINIDNGQSKSSETIRWLKVYAIEELDDEIWISTSGGIFKKTNEDFKFICKNEIYKFVVTENEIFYTSKEGFGTLFAHSCNQSLLLNQRRSSEYVRISDLLQSYDGKIWLATDDGLYRFNPQNIGTNNELLSLVFKGKVYSLVEAKSLPEVWFATDLGIGSIDYQDEQIMFLGYEDGVRQTNFITNGAFVGSEGELVFLSQDEYISFYPDLVYRNFNSPEVIIAQANLIGKNKSERHLFLEEDTLKLSTDLRHLEMSFSTLDYFAPLQTCFQYSFESNSGKEAWQTLHGNKLLISGLKPGKYVLKVKAKNSHGVESKQIRQIVFIVKAHPLLSKVAIIFYSLLLVFLVLVLIKVRTKNLIRINREYREKERIARKIAQQKEELSYKNKNITDSINYARRIQIAMMPSFRHFKAVFPDSFLLHMPKDIVSGDFYWVNHVNNKIFFSVADCTGHGVPGAFMSIIGVELFRRIVEIENIHTPGDILSSLSKNLERVFGDVDEMKLRDGMDLAFCSLNEDYTLLEYAGAFNPIYIIRNSSIMEISGDRHSVGVYEDEEEFRSFSNHVIPLQDGDLIYIFTDGFVDQFGGPEGKKYKYRRFRHLLLALHQLPLAKQEEFLKKSILEWKGDMDQVDDILVMGIRISHQKN